MPRETIYETHTSKQLAVGWERDRDVQVGVIWDRPFVFVDDEGRRIDPDTGNLANPDDDYRPSSLWVSFADRGAINKLIRTLRRARDQAFGVDA